MIDLQNLNIILTGSTGGIGGSILEKLYNSKANIIATGTNKVKLNNIKSKYENVIIKQFDISNHSSIEKFIEECNDKFEIYSGFHRGIDVDLLLIEINKVDQNYLKIDQTNTFDWNCIPRI